MGFNSAFKGLTTVRVGCLVEQLACSTAEGSRMHEGVRRKFTLAVLQNKEKIEMIRGIKAKIRNIVIQEKLLNEQRRTEGTGGNEKHIFLLSSPNSPKQSHSEYIFMPNAAHRETQCLSS